MHCAHCAVPCTVAPAVYEEGFHDGVSGLTNWEKYSTPILHCYVEGVIAGEQRWNIFIHSRVDHIVSKNQHTTVEPVIVDIRYLGSVRQKRLSSRRPNISAVERSARYEADEAFH